MCSDRVTLTPARGCKMATAAIEISSSFFHAAPQADKGLLALIATFCILALAASHDTQPLAKGLFYTAGTSELVAD